MYKSLLLFYILLALPLHMIAQTTKTIISGKVVAENGVIIQGASLMITYLPTGTIYGCATNRSGGFFIPNLEPGGPYQLEVTSVGCKKYRLANIFLKLDEPLTLSVVLQSSVNLLSEVPVTVSKSKKLPAGEKSGPIFNVDQQLMSLLPSVKRSIGDFTKLSPQAFGPAIAGGNYRQNFITIDGSEFNNNFGVGENLPGNGSQPVSLDAIAQISVNVAPYNSIWESGFIGSAVNIISRAGTNKTEASVYTYFRNQNDYGYRAGDLNIPKRDLQYHLEGFRIGGPLIKNKLFYFLSYEQETEQYDPQQLQAATQEMPYGSSPNVARPTANELNTISKYLSDHYGYQTGPYQDYNFENKSNKILFRLDWNIARNNTFSIRYNQLQSTKPELITPSRSPLTSFSASSGRRTANALFFSNSNFTTESNFYSLSAEWNSQVSTHLFNTMRASYTRQHEPRVTDSQVFPFVDILKDGVPFTSFGYEPYTYGNNRDVNVLSYTDYLHWTQGKHTWAAGFQTDYSKTRNSYMPFGTGYYTYASWDDFVTGKKPVDYANTYPSNTDQKIPEYTFDYINISAFIQHTIAVTDRISITAGVRSDLPLFPQPLQENPFLAKLAFAGGQYLHTSQLPVPTLLVAPRMAFQYNLKADKSIRLRGGTGIFTGRIPFVWIISQARYSGMYQLTQTWQGQQNTPGVFNPGAQTPVQASTPGSLPSVTSILSRNFKMPQTWKSSIALDMKLPADFNGSLEAIFNRDIRGIIFKDVNLAAPVPLNIAGYPDNRLVYPASNSDKFIHPLNAFGLPDPNGNSTLNAVVVSNSHKGYYFSAIASIEKKISNTLNFSLSYSRSTARNYNDGDGDQTQSALNATPSISGINQADLGYAGYVLPNTVISTITYSRQYAKHMKFNIGLIFQGANEGRFSYTYSKDFVRDGTNRSLIYVPLNPSEIKFAPLTVMVNNVQKTYSSQQQSDAFFQYVDNDSYLKNRKGKYAERNGALLPWRQQFDLRLSHEFFLERKGKKNTIQLSCDIINAANLLNHNWGLKNLVNASSILVPSNLDNVKPGGKVLPEFQLATMGGKLVTETFRKDYSINSTYMMQFGVRYLFE